LDRFLGDWIERPLSDPTAWADYFPSIPESTRETYDYPSPAMPGFWKLYCEPVEVFLSAAIAVAESIRAATPPPRAKKRRRNVNVGAFDEGIGMLNGLLGTVSPSIYRTKRGVIEQRWVAPSLIATFAMMALQDATGHVVRLCAFCKLPFQKASVRAQFCSDTCRDAARKVRNRKRR
jgi:hypothetical protein